MGEDHYQLSSDDYPTAITEYFGSAITISNVHYLIVHHKLINNYQAIIRLKEQNPGMFTGITKFIATLEDPVKIRSIIQDPIEIKHFIYCHNQPYDWCDGALDELVEVTKLTVRHPALIDIVSLGRETNDAEYNDIYVFASQLTYDDPRSGNKVSMRWPIGAYDQGRWKFFVPRMP